MQKDGSDVGGDAGARSSLHHRSLHPKATRAPSCTRLLRSSPATMNAKELSSCQGPSPTLQRPLRSRGIDTVNRRGSRQDPVFGDVLGDGRNLCEDHAEAGESGPVGDRQPTRRSSPWWRFVEAARCRRPTVPRLSERVNHLARVCRHAGLQVARPRMGWAPPGFGPRPCADARPRALFGSMKPSDDRRAVAHASGD